MHIKSLTSINCCWMSNNEDDECFVQSGAEQNKTYKGLSDNPAMEWADSVRTDKKIRRASQYMTPRTTISLAVEKQSERTRWPQEPVLHTPLLMKLHANPEDSIACRANTKYQRPLVL